LLDGHGFPLSLRFVARDAIDGVGQPFPLSAGPLTLRVVPKKRLGVLRQCIRSRATVLVRRPCSLSCRTCGAPTSSRPFRARGFVSCGCRSPASILSWSCRISSRCCQIRVRVTPRFLPTPALFRPPDVGRRIPAREYYSARGQSVTRGVSVPLRGARGCQSTLRSSR